MPIVHVAVAVIINQSNQVLIARRASHQHQGDKWEFPGGKVEDSENSLEALVREIQEEVGLQIQSAKHITDIIHQYDDKKVLLDVYRVENWTGEASGKEAQAIRWVEKNKLEDYEFPAANAEILTLINTRS